MATFLASNYWSSPVDPAFFLHHAQIDRVYYIWQWIGDESRQQTISGTITNLNQPPSRNGTLDDILNVEPVGQNMKIRDALSTVDGPFCYVYE